MQGSFINNQATNQNGEYTQYVVKKDDSLYKIAKKYNITVDDLIKFNHLPSNVIYPNQIILIPYLANATGKNTYLTKYGDSIKDILDKYNLTFSKLDEYNDLEKLKLLGNQLLYVGSTNNTYTLNVRESTTVDDILNKYNLSPYEFLKLNEKNFIKPGSKINLK